MDIDDLRQTLATMADEVSSTDETNRLAKVEAKVRAARRQWVGVGAGVVAVAAVVGLLVPTLLNGGDDAPSAHHSQLPTVVDNGLTFYTSPAGDTLVGEAVGHPGDRVVTLTAIPTTTDLSYVSRCVEPAISHDSPTYHVTINNKPILDSTCGDGTGPAGPGTGFTSSPSGNSRAWKDYIGVVPGQPVTVRIFFERGTPNDSVPRQLGVALYADTGQQLRDHGVWFGQQTVFEGHTYRLVTRGFEQVKGVRGKLRLALPSAEEHLLVVYGVADVHSNYRTSSDGSGSSTRGGTGSSQDALAKPDQQAAHLSIRLHGKSGALIYLLAYQRID